MLPLGTRAPDFSLVSVDGRTVELADFHGALALVVVFLCNDSPDVSLPLGRIELSRTHRDRSPFGIPDEAG